jgi:hypothetical protein
MTRRPGESFFAFWRRKRQEEKQIREDVARMFELLNAYLAKSLAVDDSDPREKGR